ncbi:MAG TPA: DUF2089 domain-containing protein [Jiangellaceae bacterium]
MADHQHVPPASCPVCDAKLRITRLGCASCGTEISGSFAACPYCALGTQDRRILQTFLVSRGNMKELARELGVSYPTARARFAELLVALGLEDDARASSSTEEILRRLAAGELDVDEAEAQLPTSKNPSD